MPCCCGTLCNNCIAPPSLTVTFSVDSFVEMVFPFWGRIQSDDGKNGLSGSFIVPLTSYISGTPQRALYTLTSGRVSISVRWFCTNSGTDCAGFNSPDLSRSPICMTAAYAQDPNPENFDTPVPPLNNPVNYYIEDYPNTTDGCNWINPNEQFLGAPSLNAFCSGAPFETQTMSGTLFTRSCSFTNVAANATRVERWSGSASIAVTALP